MKIAVITGASSGIGREFVKQIDSAEVLDEIWLIARREDKLKEISKELKNKSRIVPLDLLRTESFEEYKSLLTDDIEVRCLVNASGFGNMGDWSEIPNEAQMQMIDLNVKALVTMTNYSIPYMKKGSMILQMGSASVFNPLPYFNIYASTKSFVRHYSRALHEELKPLGIHVTVVCPGWVRTEFFDHTNDTKVRYSPKKYSPMTEAKDVVRRALRHARRNKALSIYGWFTKTQHILGKLLPHSLIMKMWMGMLKEDSK
ncbi:MAG: SDR family NAD(P)-dependent oxidoreductase [Clostridia bacterium]|nr:SDR family NAD(P)-dependent oxidoreductase [Clostridia bacterium]